MIDPDVSLLLPPGSNMLMQKIQSRDHKRSDKIHSIINQHLEQHTLLSAATVVHTIE